MSSRALTLLFALAASAALVFTAACGGSSEAPATLEPTVAPGEAPAAQGASTAVTLIEPAPGSSSGHVAYFRWSPVDGADGYRMRLTATTDGRLIWESPVLTTPEAELPNTVALEPEGYAWQVTALKGSDTVAESAPSRFAVTP